MPGRPSRWPSCRSPTGTRPSSAGWPTALTRAGFELCATDGTARALAGLGYSARLVAKTATTAVPDVGDGVPILELIGSGEVRLVVNTPTPQSGAVRDAVEIRLAATAEGILCLTAIETAVAAAEALDPAIIGAWPRSARWGSGCPAEALVAAGA